jgi:anti-sigma-K factor RskA
LDLLDFELRHLSLSPVPSNDSYLESNRLGFQPLSTKKRTERHLAFHDLVWRSCICTAATAAAAGKAGIGGGGGGYV